jgi:recombination protein RecA
MPSAAALRLEIEHALERRFPAALSPAPRTICGVAATGIAAVDELLQGGLPVGAISELTGNPSSGRTSLALQFVARRTVEERPCAWVDVQDAFDPESAAANGVRLKQLLWVRCAPSHPFRDEAAKRMGQRRASWTVLDQALRATDLLLQAGGFSSVVLDLGDTAPEQANRIPAATWFRYRQAAERTQCSLVVLGRRAYAQSAAAVVLECSAQRAEQAGGQAGGTVLRGFTFAVRRGRERHAPVEITTRKPVAATWHAHAAWDAEAERRA